MNGFLATVAREKLRSGLSASTAAPGPHDFAVRVRRLTSASAIRVHRISPRVRDVANAPLVDEMRGVMALIWVAREAEYFSMRAGQLLLICPSCQLVACPRAAICACAAGKSAGSRARRRFAGWNCTRGNPSPLSSRAVGSPHERSDMRDGVSTKLPDVASFIRATLAEDVEIIDCRQEFAHGKETSAEFIPAKSCGKNFSFRSN